MTATTTTDTLTRSGGQRQRGLERMLLRLLVGFAAFRVALLVH